MPNLTALREVAGDGPKAIEAIFWFCYAWHSGRDSDLYKIMHILPFSPDPKKQFADDPEVVATFDKLDRAFGPMDEHPLLPVKLADVHEDDVLIAGTHHACIANRWPCRVFKLDGKLTVMCADGFHTLHAGADGNVKGFRR